MKSQSSPSTDESWNCSTRFPGQPTSTWIVAETASTVPTSYRAMRIQRRSTASSAAVIGANYQIGSIVPGVEGEYFTPISSRKPSIRLALEPTALRLSNTTTSRPRAPNVKLETHMVKVGVNYLFRGF